MDISSHIQTQMDQAQSAFDIAGLDNLRKGAQKGERAALEKTAQEFEAIFIHMMLKSMRAADDVLADENSPFNSQQVKFYRDMQDQQMATDMASSGTMGLSELLVQQLDPTGSGVTPASVVRKGGNLSDFLGGARDGHNAVNNTESNSAGDQSLLNKLSQLQMRSASAASGSDAAGNGNVSSNVSPNLNPNLNQGASKQSAFNDADDFIQSLLPVAQQVAGELGIDPKALVAQAAVETGWGQYMIHSGSGNNTHNLFGIKAGREWQGNKEVVETLEYQQGTPEKQKAAFRSYDDFHDSMQDYVQFIKQSPRYRNAVEQSGNSESYFRQLQQAGYATDPAYADKVMSVLNSDKLSGANVNAQSNSTFAATQSNDQI